MLNMMGLGDSNPVDDIYTRFSHDVTEERSLPKRVASYLTPVGFGMLLLATFMAASAMACTESCVISAELREERLLECEEHCKSDISTLSSCKDRCKFQLDLTLNRVRRQQRKCKEACPKSQSGLRSAAVLGVVCILAITPILGSYRGSCRCECCMGLGCSGRLAMLNIAWVFYGMSTLWVIPSVIELPTEIGGKVLFMITQGVAIVSMFGSRHFAEKDAQAGKAPGELMPVGQPVGGPCNEDLVAQVKILQRQVGELILLQQQQLEQTPLTAAVAQPAQPPMSPPAMFEQEVAAPPMLL